MDNLEMNSTEDIGSCDEHSEVSTLQGGIGASCS